MSLRTLAGERLGRDDAVQVKLACVSVPVGRHSHRRPLIALRVLRSCVPRGSAGLPTA